MTLNDFLVVGGGVLALLVLFLLAPVVYDKRAAIVSVISGMSARVRSEGEARRAYRQRVYTMSTVADLPPRTAFAPLEPIPVLAPVHQEVESSIAKNEPERELVNLRQLPKQDLIVLLTVQRDEEGKYIYSSNDITKFVGGTAADVKALIAAVRAEKPTEQAARLGHFPRPVNGWGR